MVFLFAITGILYLLLIASLIYGWKKVPEFKPEDQDNKTRFSIIIPFRNEAGNLPKLLNSLSKLHYPDPNFEILLVNDESEDTSEKICNEFIKDHPLLNARVLQNKRRSNSPKKDAISTAIENAQFEYLLTTDADCLVPELWLQAYNDFILENKPKLVAGPVRILNTEKKKALFQTFEELDILSLQATGIGAFGIDRPFICNGANLCYEKKAFEEAGKFTGNEDIASGDDVFLLQKFRKTHLKTGFLKAKEAIVETTSQESLKQLISQHIRWAAKTPAYTSLFGRFAGITVFLTNLLLLLGIPLVFFELLSYTPLVLLFFVKFNADFILLYTAAKFFEREDVMRNYFWCSFLYPFFSVFVAFLSLFKDFEWKGRKFSK